VGHWGDGLRHFMTMGITWVTDCNGERFYLCSLGNWYILSVYFESTQMMDAQATETCWWISMYDKAYFISVRLLVCHVSVNIVSALLQKPKKLFHQWK